MPVLKRKQQSANISNTSKPWVNWTWLLALCLAFLLGRHSRGPETLSASTSSRSLETKQENVNHKETHNDDGWHSIDVFYGDAKHLDRTPPPPAFRGAPPNAVQDWYGQAKQDQLVFELLNGKTNGYFIDLAANDARTFSNTFALERHHNWTGLCIEPNPQYWHDLSYRNCKVVAAVVGANRMEEVQFRFPSGVNGVLGGIVDDKYDITTKKDQQANHEQPPTPKYTVPLLEILQRYNAPKNIDYLSLDVEGAEEYIMSVFPLQHYQVNVLTIERPSPGLERNLKQHGFQMVQKITRWGETLWQHQSFR